MRRTTISFEDPTLEQLQRLAAERRTSVAAVIRAAVDEQLASHPPKPRSLGIAQSGHADTARLSGEVRPEPRSWR
jgi:predicted DNA-binding ribbon-helix-helix protein